MTAPTSALSAMGPAARDAYDGQPFFCTWCGGEYRVGCGSTCCELEEEWRAEERAWLYATVIPDDPALEEAAE